MLKIKKKEYRYDGTKTECVLTVDLEYSKIFDEIPLISERVERELYKRYQNNLWFHKVDGGLEYEYVVRGVSKCNESVDKYDTEKGKKIAFQRALVKLNRMELVAASCFNNAVMGLYVKFDGMFAKAAHHLDETMLVEENLTK